MVELMVATIISLILSLSVLEVYIAQTNSYRTTNSQGIIQNLQNAIGFLVTPVVRSAGFIGCGSMSTAVSNLNAGGPNPLGNLNTSPSMVMGYNGGSSSITTQADPNNDTSSSNWTPALDTSLTGNVVRGSDVLVVLGSSPDSFPLTVSTIDTTTSALVLSGTFGVPILNGQYAAVSDCVKTIIFNVTGVSGDTISHASGSGPLNNTNSAFSISFQPGSQFIPLQQTAFFVGRGPGGQAALMVARLNGASWTILPLIPGVETMKVQYGIGTNGRVSQYVSANAVTNWSQVYALRIGFLLAGKPGSGYANTGPFMVLDTSVTAPSDTRIRQTYEISINLRNAVI